jgi:hypothetical protein
MLSSSVSLRYSSALRAWVASGKLSGVFAALIFLSIGLNYLSLAFYQNLCQKANKNPPSEGWISVF